MFDLVILIPVRDNDGDDFPESAFALFEEILVTRFGGFTCEAGTASGGWAFEGRVYRDETRVYHVAMRTIGDGVLVVSVVAFAKSHFRQEAIFIRYLNIIEIL